jgi:TRAP-type C4-dicarboxylate transport system permease small subunit
MIEASSVKRLERFLEAFLVLILVVTVGMVLVQVFSRYVLQLPIQGLEELARLTFVWGCFIGAGLCYMRGEHLCIDYFLNKLPKRGSSIVRLFLHAVILAISLIMIWAGTKFVVDKWVYPDHSTALFYPRSLFILPIPLCGLIVLGHTITLILEDVKPAFSRRTP